MADGYWNRRQPNPPMFSSGGMLKRPRTDYGKLLSAIIPFYVAILFVYLSKILFISVLGLAAFEISLENKVENFGLYWLNYVRTQYWRKALL